MLKPEVYERESKHTRPNLDQRDFRKVKRKLQRLMSRNDQRSTLPALQGFLQSEPSVELSDDECGRSPRATGGEPTPPTMYPLLESLLRQKGLKLKGIYTLDDACEIFAAGTRPRASRRSIQERMSRGELRSRSLPGHGKFLSEDFEEYLKNSLTDPTEKRTSRRG
jgi:hypothetical protein